MPSCRKIKKKADLICTGDLDKRITIFVRDITVPVGGSVDYGESFSVPTTVWAMIETLSKGVQIFDGANVVDTASHNIYIRYRPAVTFENYLDYEGRRFRILNTENLNERNRYIKLQCTERGDNVLPVNFT